MKCPQCGNDNPADAQFCGGCGVSLSASTVSGTGIASYESPMVSFPEAIKLGFKNYANFGGRATRAEYWWLLLFLGGFPIAAIGGGILLVSFFLLDNFLILTVLGFATVIGFGILGLIGIIVLIVWAIKQGDEGPNKYGPDPRQTTSQQPYKP